MMRPIKVCLFVIFEEEFCNRLFRLDEEIYVLAMYLHLFHQHCFPSWSIVYAIASRIMIDLSSNDSELDLHLKTISKIRPKFNPKVWIDSPIECRNNYSSLGFFLKDFLPEMLSLEAKPTNSAHPNATESPTDPIIFLRKWISQVNTLSPIPLNSSFISGLCRYPSFEFFTVLLGSIFHGELE